jgi:hypothetical protein
MKQLAPEADGGFWLKRLPTADSESLPTVLLAAMPRYEVGRTENGCNHGPWRRRNHTRSWEGNAVISSWMNKLSSSGKGAVMFRLYRNGWVSQVTTRQHYAEFGLRIV